MKIKCSRCGIIIKVKGTKRPLADVSVAYLDGKPYCQACFEILVWEQKRAKRENEVALARKISEKRV